MELFKPVWSAFRWSKHPLLAVHTAALILDHIFPHVVSHIVTQPHGTALLVKVSHAAESHHIAVEPCRQTGGLEGGFGWEVQFGHELRVLTEAVLLMITVERKILYFVDYTLQVQSHHIFEL